MVLHAVSRVESRARVNQWQLTREPEKVLPNWRRAESATDVSSREKVAPEAVADLGVKVVRLCEYVGMVNQTHVEIDRAEIRANA